MAQIAYLLLCHKDPEGIVAQAERLTPQTITKKTELRRAILKARSDGYSLVDQEVELGFRSISVALRRRDGKAIGSLNVGVHSERGSLDTMIKTFLPKLRALADDLQQQLI